MNSHELLVPSVVPVARRTTEIHLALANNILESEDQAIDIDRPGTLVGLDIAVIIDGVTVGGGLRAPTIDDVMLIVEGNDLLGKLTKREERDGTVQGRFYSSARALDMSRRLLMIELDAPTKFRIQARWKRFISGTPIYEGALISVSCLYNFQTDGGAS
jgi:hypothetical protein